MTSFDTPFSLSWPDDSGRVIRGQVTVPSAAVPSAAVPSIAAPSTQGLPISGGSIRLGWPCVVIAHGYALHKDWGFFPAIASRLAACGIASVRFNFSGHGVGPSLAIDEERFVTNTYIDEIRDLEIIREWVGTHDDLDNQRIGYVGHSRGGGMGLVHAAEDGTYRSVVTWATIEKTLQFTPERVAQWRRDGFVEVMHWTARRRMKLRLATLHSAEQHAARLDILAACARIRCPVVAIHGLDDRAIDIEASRQIVAACPSGTLFPIEGGDHVFGASHPLLGMPRSLDLALERTAQAFEHL